MNPFYYAHSLLDTLYGIEVDEDEFEEIAIIAWGLLGNRRSKLYRFSTCLEECKMSVLLPCNFIELEAVTADYEDWNSTSNTQDFGEPESYIHELYNESMKSSKSPYYLPGKFAKYEKVGDTLYFTQPYGRINILYKGEVVDDEGLPEITDKEATAIATYCAYVIKMKEGYRTNNGNIINFAESLRMRWLNMADQARAGEYMSQNDWDNVLDAKTSWNRKSFGKSLKLYK